MSPADLPRDFPSLALAVLLLGIRHGFDADHLAAIDGLTRFNADTRPRLARRVGALFALGHGTVVVGVALAVSMLARGWQVPGWLESFGGWTSIAILTLLAAINVRAVLATPADEATRLRGWRSGTFSRLLHARTPVAVGGVGGLFALSFDTLSLAVLFAIAAAAYGGWPPALVLAASFVAGMLVVDGINGRWISALIARSDRTALVASRTMALAVAGVGLFAAGVGVATRTVPAFAQWRDGREVAFGIGVVVVIATSFVVGQRLARQATDRHPAADVPFASCESHPGCSRSSTTA